MKMKKILKLILMIFFYNENEEKNKEINNKNGKREDNKILSD